MKPCEGRGFALSSAESVDGTGYRQTGYRRTRFCSPASYAAQQSVLFLKTMSRWAALERAKLPVTQAAVAVSTDEVLVCQ